MKFKKGMLKRKITLESLSEINEIETILKLAKKKAKKLIKKKKENGAFCLSDLEYNILPAIEEIEKKLLY